MRVAIVQGSPVLFDKKANSEKILETLERYEADLYVFGELFFTGYMIKNHVMHLSEDLKSPSKELREVEEGFVERGKYGIIGIPERGEGRRYYNSALVLGPSGILGSYRKRKLPNFGPFREYMYFSPGSSPFCFEATGAKIGVQICYDVFFPEISSEYRDMEIDILVTISASPITSRSLFEKLIPARAIETTSYHVYVNLAGTEEDLLFWGGSRVCSPKGEEIVKCKYYEEEVKIAELDLKRLRVFRQFRPVLRDSKMGSAGNVKDP